MSDSKSRLAALADRINSNSAHQLNGGRSGSGSGSLNHASGPPIAGGYVNTFRGAASADKRRRELEYEEDMGDEEDDDDDVMIIDGPPPLPRPSNAYNRSTNSRGVLTFREEELEGTGRPTRPSRVEEPVWISDSDDQEDDYPVAGSSKQDWSSKIQDGGSGGDVADKPVFQLKQDLKQKLAALDSEVSKRAKT
jgi:hypothetical protein